MTTREVIDVMAALAVIAGAAALLGVGLNSRRPALASCASLYRIARTPADSLYIAVNRGDCAP